MSNKQQKRKYPVTIDYDACKGCGICSSVCIFSILTPDPETRKPMVSDNQGVTCSKCGHCEVYCPESAVRVVHSDNFIIDSDPGSRIITKDQIANLIHRRRSIRKYHPKSVPQEIIEEILDCVRYAPTALNLQTVRWHIIYDKACVRMIAQLTVAWMREMAQQNRLGMTGADPYFPYLISRWDEGIDMISHDAPHLLIAYSGNDSHNAYTDAVIATSYLDLIVPVFGLGTCWAGIINRAAKYAPDVLHAMDIPEGNTPQTVMMFGYPKYKQLRIPQRDAVKITWK